jgi:tRNA-Thr(GGU) m(6)t(6)A37 methyltransferase TsaA
MEISLTPIGIIHSPFATRETAPIQATRSQAVGQVEIFPEFLDGLQDLEGFSHIILLYLFHQSKGYSLLVKPFLDNRLRGLFATRHPNRPNPIGISIVRLSARRGQYLDICGLDMLDGTPLLDIKPFVPDFDLRSGATAGWYTYRSVE